MSLKLLDPYNEKELEKITTYEKENNIGGEIINHIKQKINSKEVFDNDIDEIIINEEKDKIIECCYITGEKDIKMCSIKPITKKDKLKISFLDDVTTYAINNLGMKEVFVSVSKENTNLIKQLVESKGFENLGEVDKTILLLKESIEKDNNQRKI